MKYFRCASIFGFYFEGNDLLRSIYNFPNDVSEALENLCSLSMLYRRSTDSYSFAHQIAQEVYLFVHLFVYLFLFCLFCFVCLCLFVYVCFVLFVYVCLFQISFLGNLRNNHPLPKNGLAQISCRENGKNRCFTINSKFGCWIMVSDCKSLEKSK